MFLGKRSVLIVPTVALVGLLGLSGCSSDPAPEETVSPPASASVDAVDAGVGGESVSASESASASPSASASAEPFVGSQDETAKKALERLVPVWGTVPIRSSGNDVDAWVDSFRDLPEVSSEFIDNSEQSYLGLNEGALKMGVDVNVKDLKDVHQVWKSDELSGWVVTADREWTNDAVRESDEMSWEFTVEYDPDEQTSQVVSVTPQTGSVFQKGSIDHHEGDGKA